MNQQLQSLAPMIGAIALLWGLIIRLKISERMCGTYPTNKKALKRANEYAKRKINARAATATTTGAAANTTNTTTSAATAATDAATGASSPPIFMASSTPPAQSPPTQFGNMTFQNTDLYTLNPSQTNMIEGFVNGSSLAATAVDQTGTVPIPTLPNQAAQSPTAPSPTVVVPNKAVLNQAAPSPTVPNQAAPSPTVSNEVLASNEMVVNQAAANQPIVNQPIVNQSVMNHSAANNGGANVANNRSRKPIFVLYHAPWCGACKKFKPHFDRVREWVKQTGMSIILEDHDITQGDTPSSIQAIPTLVCKNEDGSMTEVTDRAWQKDESSLREFVIKNSA